MVMRWLVARSVALTSVALASLAVAGPAAPSEAPARRKPASESYGPAALSAFIDGLLHDKAGELDKAVHSYEDSLKANPQPNTHYNIGDLRRRMEQYDKAIASFEAYLALAPRAPDRKAVERLIQELKDAPPVLVIDGDDLGAIVLVDGKLIGPSPVVLQVSVGDHHVDRLGPTTFRGTSVSVKAGDIKHVKLSPNRRPTKAEGGGNVVLAGSPVINTIGSWKDPTTGIEFRFPGRFDLAPGHHETVLWNPGRACTKIAFDVPRTDDLTYVFVDATPPARPGGCYPIKVRTQKIKVPR